MTILPTRRWRFFLLGPALVAAAGCGSRSDLDPFGAPGGGGSTSSSSSTGTTSGSTTTSSSATTTGLPLPNCPALTVLSPIQIVPGPFAARAPGLGLLPESGEVLVAAREVAAPGELLIATFPAFSSWPSRFAGPVPVTDGIFDLACGPGPGGPVALLDVPGGSTLALQLHPELQTLDIPFASSDEALFAAAIPDRYLGAGVTKVAEYGVLHVGSYQPGSLPQSEEPLVCATSRLLGAAVPVPGGFLAAFSEPDAAAPCDPQNPLPATVAAVSRYTSPPEAGSFLERTPGHRFETGEPLVHLDIAPRSDGAWVVHQTNGSTSRDIPPVMAWAVNKMGGLANSIPVTAVTPGGQIPSAMAVAAMGARLAVAWVDSLDPSAPTIVLQLVEPTGALGPATSILTSEVWLSGRVELLASPDGKSLLVAWEAFDGADVVALARIDCAGD